MPGIYGYIKKNENESQIAQMTKMMNSENALRKENIYKDKNIEASQIKLGMMSPKYFSNLSKEVHIWVEGEFYNHEINDLSEFILTSYLKDSLKENLKSIDGYFNAVIYDSKINKIFLISDRYGMRMLYYYFKDGNFAWAGELKALLNLNFVDKTIDSKQINCFIDIGHLLEENTYHKNIKLIKPATILEYDISTKKMEEKYYWKWSQIRPQNISFDDAINQLGKLFIESVNKRFNPNQKIGIALSGGLDSRAIFAAVEKLHPEYIGYSYTFGTPNCLDINIAKEVINKSNWKHETFIFDNKNWFNYRLKKSFCTDGMLNILHMHGCEFEDEVKDNIDFNLNGYLGDVILGGSYIADKSEYANKRINIELAKDFYKGYSNDKYIESDFFDINSLEPFLAMNRGRRFINMGTVSGLNKVNQRLPFFDNNLIEFIYSLPDEYRFNNALYSRMLLKYFPKYFKKIPWQKTRNTIDKPLSKIYYFHELIRKFKRIPYKLKILRDLSCSYVNYPEWIREKTLANNICEILNKDDARYKNEINYNFNERYLDPHLKNNINYSEQILRAVTIENYLTKTNKFIN